MILFKTLKASITWPVPELVSLLGICSSNISLPDIKISIHLKQSSLKQQMLFPTGDVTNVASLSVSYSSGSLTRMYLRCQLVLQCHLKVQLRVESLSRLWGTGLRLRSTLRAPSVPCHIGLSNRMAGARMAAGFHRVNVLEKAGEGTPEASMLISEVTCITFAAFCPLKVKSLCPAHTLSGSFSERFEYCRAGITWGRCRGHVLW